MSYYKDYSSTSDPGATSMPVAPLGGVFQAEGNQWVNINTTSSTPFYEWSTNTDATDPTVGFVKGDEDELDDITEIYISSTPAGGGDIDAVLEIAQAGDFFGYIRADDNSKRALFRITGDSINNGGWFTVPVEVESSVGEFEDGDDINTVIIAAAGRDKPIFGSEYQAEIDDSTNSTSSSTYQTKLTLTTPTIPTGEYKIEYTFELTHSSNNSPVQAAVEIDGSVENLTNNEIRDGNEYELNSGFTHKSWLEGSHEIEIQWRSPQSGTARIRRARIVLYRVA